MDPAHTNPRIKKIRKKEKFKINFLRPNRLYNLKIRRLTGRPYLVAKDKIVLKVLINEPDGKRPSGRPRHR